MAQEQFKNKFVKLLVGMVALTGTTEKITLIPNEAIPFGVAVKRGTVVGTANKISATTDKVVGVSVHRHNELGLYSISEEMAVATKGNMAVAVLGSDTVTAGDNAFMIVTAGADYGKFTKTAGANTVACGVFQGVKEDGIAVVKFDIIA
jgi:hypothetical protein